MATITKFLSMALMLIEMAECSCEEFVTCLLKLVIEIFIHTCQLFCLTNTYLEIFILVVDNI